jgi:hypothetical protein
VRVEMTASNLLPDVERLLGEGLSLRAAGERLGVSGEWVRQLAEKLGIETGISSAKWKERMAARRLARLARAALPQLIQEVSRAAASRGLSFEPMVNSTSDGYLWHWAQVGTHLCNLRRLSITRVGSKEAYRLGPSFGRADFRIWMGSQDLALIIPEQAVPMNGTLFVPSAVAPAGAKSRRHDYARYLNAWYLLRSGGGAKIMLDISLTLPLYSPYGEARDMEAERERAGAEAAGRGARGRRAAAGIGGESRADLEH